MGSLYGQYDIYGRPITGDTLVTALSPAQQSQLVGSTGPAINLVNQPAPAPGTGALFICSGGSCTYQGGTPNNLSPVTAPAPPPPPAPAPSYVAPAPAYVAPAPTQAPQTTFTVVTNHAVTPSAPSFTIQTNYYPLTVPTGTHVLLFKQTLDGDRLAAAMNSLTKLASMPWPQSGNFPLQMKTWAESSTAFIVIQGDPQPYRIVSPAVLYQPMSGYYGVLVAPSFPPSLPLNTDKQITVALASTMTSYDAQYATAIKNAQDTATAATAAATAAAKARDDALAAQNTALAQAKEAERLRLLAVAQAAQAELAKQQALAAAAAATAAQKQAVADAQTAANEKEAALQQKNAALQAQAQAEAQRDLAVQQRNEAVVNAMQTVIQQAQTEAQVQAAKEQAAADKLAAQLEKQQLIQTQLAELQKVFAKAQADQEAAVQRAIQAEQAKAQLMLEQERNTGTCPSFPEGFNVRNAAKQVFKFENGTLRLYPNAEIYKSHGSPPFSEGYREVDLNACPRGAEMPLTCPTTMFKEGDIVVDGTDGSTYKISNGALRRMSASVYRALGNPQYKTFAAELQKCPMGPPLELADVVTLSPTTSAPPSTTPTPTRQSGSPPPQMLRSPNVVVFVHARTWLTQGKLALLGLENGALTGGPVTGLNNVFKISTQGVLTTLGGTVLAASPDCTGLNTSRSALDAPWEFEQLSSSPLHFSVAPLGCDKALGLRAVGSQATLMEKGDRDASWFVLPIRI